MKAYQEKAFEDLIEEHLLSCGWLGISAEDYDKEGHYQEGVEQYRMAFTFRFRLLPRLVFRSFFVCHGLQRT